MADELNIYSLSRNWFDFSFSNPEKIRPNHTALYFFAIEHCNRLGWKKKFGFPTTMAMEAIGIKSYNTYKDTLRDLVDWGFIIMIELSKNQYSANIIALSKNDKASNKALDKALTKHTTKHCIKQSESTVQSIDSIDKQVYNNTSLPINNKSVYREFKHLKISLIEIDKLFSAGFSQIEVDDILNRIENYAKNKNFTSLYLTALNWLKGDRKKQKDNLPEKGIKRILAVHEQIKNPYL